MQPVGSSKVTPSNPPLEISGMQLVVLDAAGRLQEFRTIPPQRGPSAAVDVPAPRWQALFRAAGLDMTAYREVPPRWTPRQFADCRVAWEGPMPGLPAHRLRLEGASYRGRPVSFLLVPDWTAPRLMGAVRSDLVDRIFLIIAIVVFVILTIAAVVLARRNLRGDRAQTTRTFRRRICRRRTARGSAPDRAVRATRP